MAWAIRSGFWFLFGLDLLFNAFSRYLHPPTDPFAIKGLFNVMSGILGALFVYGAGDTYRRRNLSAAANPDATSPRTMMWIWVLGATSLLFIMFWPLARQLSFDLRSLVRMALFVYFLFEAREGYLENKRRLVVRAENSVLTETGRGSIGLKVMAAIVIAIGMAVVSVGLWYAKSEWSKVNDWPRTAAVLVDKKISPVGARLIFEYDVTGGRSAGRVDRWGQEAEMRTFLEPYRLGNSYPIGYNPQDASEVEFHLGYHWDLFRGPIAIMFFGALFAAAGLALGAPWREAPRL